MIIRNDPAVVKSVSVPFYYRGGQITRHNQLASVQVCSRCQIILGYIALSLTRLERAAMITLSLHCHRASLNTSRTNKLAQNWHRIQSKALFSTIVMMAPMKLLDLISDKLLTISRFVRFVSVSCFVCNNVRFDYFF